jgi:hypothetical protein
MHFAPCKLELGFRKGFMMSGVNDRYTDWPVDAKARAEVARDVAGQHFVAAHDSWVNTAKKMLFEHWRYPTPDIAQQQFLDWIAALSDEDRQNALLFVRDIVRGVIFSLLNDFDGGSGSVLKATHFEHIAIALEIRSRENMNLDSVPIEKIPLFNMDDAELHELWFEWLEKFSRISEP